MLRVIFWMIMLSLVVGLCTLLWLKFTLPQEDSIVYLKDGTSAIGYVTRKDNYIIVTKEASEQVLPWDEVKSISGPKPLASKSSIFGYWVDKLDFLSSLGVLAALVVFSAGLYQYQQGLLWKREEFLSARLKAFGSSRNVNNATRMLESLAQYHSATVELYPEKQAPDQSSVSVSNQDIISSLEIPVGDVEHAARIRESFDTFLDYLEALDHDIQLRVVEKKSVYVQLGYWLSLLGRYDKLRDDYRKQIINYAEHFGYDGFLRIIRRYNKGHRFWWWLRGKRKSKQVDRSRSSPPRVDNLPDNGDR